MENFEKDHYWEFTLRDNPLTKENDKDCIAEVKSGPKTLHNEDIAKEIKRTGSEFKYETILSIVTQHNGIIADYLMDGQSVMTDLCLFSPRILGAFPTSKAEFDPNVNKLTFDIVLSKEMRERLKKVKTINRGMKPDVAEIGLVTDTSTGISGDHITPSEDIQIDGSRIKVVGEDAGIGVFFIAEDGTETKVTRRLTRNDPSCLIARVPALADGKYTLRIVTKYSQSNSLLKEPRVLEYANKLQVGNGGGDRPEIE